MIESKPLVSVIVPAFNRVKYINETVQSVLQQAYPSVELIVVDDGSSDGTYEELQSYGDKIVLLTHNQHANCGQSASINRGLAVAKGEFIAILDSDDYWADNKLAVQANFLINHPDIGLVYANGYHVDSDGKRLHPFHAADHQEHNDPNRVLMDCYMLLPQNALVRRSIYTQVGCFNESYRAAQDHDMLIRIAEVARFAYLPDYLFFYRRHGDSISSKGQERRWRNGFKILEDAKNRYPYRPSTIRKRLAVLNFRMAQVMFKDRKYLHALLFLIKSGFLDPSRGLAVLSGIESTH